MISPESTTAAQRARAIYESRLREQMEREHFGRYVCIEPESGKYFLGDTFDDAVNAAIDAFPDRLTYTLHVGHPAALHIGMAEQ